MNFFNGWVIFHSVYVPKLPYPFICWWASRLLPCPGNYKQCCNEHCDARVSFRSGFLGVYAQEWDCWVIWQFYFQFFKNFHTVLHSGCTTLHSHQPCRLLDSSHSDWLMVPHCVFDLHFSDNEWCWAYFHVFVSHLYVFFWEMSF